jgi:hypothetical protein
VATADWPNNVLVLEIGEISLAQFLEAVLTETLEDSRTLRSHKFLDPEEFMIERSQVVLLFSFVPSIAVIAIINPSVSLL